MAMLGIFVFKTMAECDGGSGDLNIPVETVRVSQLIVILTLSPPHHHYLTTFYWLLTSNHHLCLPVIKNSSAGPASLNCSGSGGEVLSFLWSEMH